MSPKITYTDILTYTSMLAYKRGSCFREGKLGHMGKGAEGVQWLGVFYQNDRLYCLSCCHAHMTFPKCFLITDWNLVTNWEKLTVYAFSFVSHLFIGRNMFLLMNLYICMCSTYLQFPPGVPYHPLPGLSVGFLTGGSWRKRDPKATDKMIFHFLAL